MLCLGLDKSTVEEEEAWFTHFYSSWALYIRYSCQELD